MLIAVGVLLSVPLEKPLKIGLNLPRKRETLLGSGGRTSSPAHPTACLVSWVRAGSESLGCTVWPPGYGKQHSADLETRRIQRAATFCQQLLLQVVCAGAAPRGKREELVNRLVDLFKLAFHPTPRIGRLGLSVRERLEALLIADGLWINGSWGGGRTVRFAVTCGGQVAGAPPARARQCGL